VTRSRRNALITADAIQEVNNDDFQDVIVKTGSWELTFFHVSHERRLLFDSISARELKTGRVLHEFEGFTVKVKYDYDEPLPEEIELLRQTDARFDYDTRTLTLISSRWREPSHKQLSKQTVYALLRQAKEIEVIAVR
jgi:hypothetical protein